MYNYQSICNQVIEIVKETAQFQRREYDKLNRANVAFKDKNDLVSYVDIESEKYLIDKLKPLIIGAEFLAEEGHADIDCLRDQAIWIIDPLDGTTNYVHQVPVFSISVALYVNKKAVIGVVYEVIRDECFYAWQDSPSFLNGKEIHVKENDSIQNALIGTGFPIKNFEVKESYLRIFSELIEKSRGLRRLGSAAVDLAYVSCGRYDAFFEYNLNPWDVAAGLFIVQQAGGEVSDFSGGDNYLFGKQILAASSALFKDMQRLIEEKK
ncbi:MAG: inositol monophosphatase [Bacteroidetes bacterium]|nr:inositol monophosphatase [Bacteroidota bacterium]MBT7996395.1 inositol monophosphatase [Bacteroidota bacterium]